jgi:hypothetical protein
MSKKSKIRTIVYNEISNDTYIMRCKLTIYKINKQYKFEAIYNKGYNEYNGYNKKITSNKSISWKPPSIEYSIYENNIVLRELMNTPFVSKNVSEILIKNAIVDKYSPVISILGLHTWRLTSHICKDYLRNNINGFDYTAVCICFNMNYDIEIYGITHLYSDMTFGYHLLNQFPGNYNLKAIANHGMNINKNIEDDKYQLWFGISQDKQLQKKVDRIHNKISVALHNQLTDFTHIIGIQNIIINYVV